MSQVPFYPSLSSGAGALIEPQEVIPSILRHMFATPATSSDYFEGDNFNHKISFRRLEAEFGHNPSVFCDQYKGQISAVIRRYFPNRDIIVETHYRHIDELTGNLEDEINGSSKSPRYVVFLDIQERKNNGEMVPIIVSGTIDINKNTHEFTIHFAEIPHAK